MTRREYLSELRIRLGRLSSEEAEAAVAFYDEYFEDAESDEAAIETLGPPGRVAAQILAETSAQLLNESPVSPYRLAPEKASGLLTAGMPRGSFPNYLDGRGAAAAQPADTPADRAARSSEPGNGADSALPESPAVQPESSGETDAFPRREEAENPGADARVFPGSSAAGGYTRDTYRPPVRPDAGPATAGSLPPGAGQSAPRTGQSAYTQNGYTQSACTGGAAPSAPVQSPYTTPEGRRSSLSSIWYVILGILALPVAFPLILVAVILIIVFGVLCLVLIILFFAGIVTLIAGSATSVHLFFTTGTGIVSLGSAFILFGAALILIPLFILFAMWLVRAVGKVSAKLFNKLKARSEEHEKHQ